jgi:transposase
VHTSFVGKEDGTILAKYDKDVKTRAIRLVRDYAGDYDTEWAAIREISSRLGMSAETLRKWPRQAEVDAG